MKTGVQLESMTTLEKLGLLEAIWTDLSRNPDDVESPCWHKQILEEREQRIASGESRFIDWEQAKAEILKEIR